MKLLKKLWAFLEGNEVLVLILLATLVLRIPSLFEPNRYADEDIYLTLGMAVRKGLTLYSQIHDNKPPFIYWLAALAQSVMWFRFMLLVWNLINITIIWKLAEKLIKNKNLVILATALMAIFSTIPLLEGNIANGEIFMIMPACSAVLLMAEGYMGFWVGILFSLGFLFKIPVAFDMAGLFLWWLLYKGWNKKLLIAGFSFLIPIGITMAYYAFRGAFPQYVSAAFLQNLGYVSSYEGAKRPFYESGLFVRGLFLLGSLGLVWLRRKNLGKNFGLVFLWFVFGLFGANLSGRPYPHYLIEIVPAGSLLLAMLMEEKSFWRITFGGLAVGLTSLAVIYYQFWYYQSWPYYLNFIDYSLGRKTQEQYFAFWGNGVTRNMTIARIIKESTNKDDKIFVWGTEPAIYVESDRLPVGKYTVSYHIFDFKAEDTTAKLLNEEKPKMIVVMDSERDFPQLRSLLAKNYLMVRQIEDAKIYMRTGKLTSLLY